MSLLDTFVATHNGVATDLDGAFGAQCVDLADAWANTLGHPLPLVAGAKDFAGQTINGYTWISNDPNNSPQPGDIVIWNSLIGLYGHVAICIEQGNTNTFKSLDQNWVNSGPNGSPAAEVVHGYVGVAGWFRPDNLGGNSSMGTTFVEVTFSGVVDRVHAGVGPEKANQYDQPDGSVMAPLPADGNTLTVWQSKFDGSNWWDRISRDGSKSGDWWMLDAFLNDGGLSPLDQWKKQQVVNPPTVTPIPTPVPAPVNYVTKIEFDAAIADLKAQIATQTSLWDALKKFFGGK